MKIAYVVAPYRATGWFWDRAILKWVKIFLNILDAREIAKELWKEGYCVICPHSNTAFFDGLCPDDVWLRGSMLLMMKADVVVVHPDWVKSEGCRAEVTQSITMNKEIIYL